MTADNHQIMQHKSSSEEEDGSMDEETEASVKLRQARAVCSKHSLSVEMKHSKAKRQFTCERVHASKDLDDKGEHAFKTNMFVKKTVHLSCITRVRQQNSSRVFGFRIPSVFLSLWWHLGCSAFPQET